MNSRRGIYLVLVAATAIGLALFQRFETGPAATEEAPYSAADFLRGSGNDDFRKVTEARDFSFPRDHGPHNDYRSEWWYFTGNLDDDTGRHFGFQLTFFRFSPSARVDRGSSAWRTNQVFMAHFALTDVAAGTFHAFERFSRAAAGLAGASSEGLKVWLDDWSANALEGSGLPLQLEARQDGIGLSLVLGEGKPLVLHGDGGISTKNSEPGNASYYYSFTRLPTTGHVRIGSRQYRVSGNSWMDREWSSSALGKDQLGWDWFALQLSNNTELMYYRLRRQDGLPDPYSYAALIQPDGSLEKLDASRVQLEVLEDWTSRQSGVSYPAAWRIRIPGHGLELEARPQVSQQEINRSFRYWEGAVMVQGRQNNADISGRGYVELTGY